MEDTAVPGPAGDLAVGVYRPRQEPGAGAPPVVAFFHGGGFVLGGIESHDGRARMLAESLAGPPPAVIAVAGFDPLRDEGIAYADALGQAGVPVVLRHYEVLVHGFFGMGSFSAAADRASRQLCHDFGRLLGTRELEPTAAAG